MNYLAIGKRSTYMEQKRNNIPMRSSQDTTCEEEETLFLIVMDEK